MTREEQIIQASDEWTYQKPPQYSELVHKTHKVMCAYQVGFIDDAVWADSHPRWISVKDYTKDELPPLIDKNNPYGESVQALFVVVLDGVQFINKGTFDYDTGVWHSLEMQCSFCKENVTHWMPLPQLPSL